MRSRLVTALVVASLAGAPVAAQDDFDDLDDLLGGFEEEDPDFEVEKAAAGTSEERWWDLSGSVELSGTVNLQEHRSATGTKYRGLQRLRTRLNLQLDLDLPDFPADGGGLSDTKVRVEGWVFSDLAYVAHGRSRYSDEVLGAYEIDGEGGEAWIQSTVFDFIDVKLGRQIVIWGRSESLRVLDVLNPLDNREPGRVDLEDLRRPLGMLRVDGYVGDWSASLLVIPEIRFDRLPVVGSDFFPAPAALPEIEPDDFEDVELAGAVTGIFSGWDVSFHGAWFWNDTPHVDALGRLVHDRLWLVGSGGNWTRGGWLLKYEVAWVSGLGSFYATEDKDRADVLFGFEYYGFDETTISVEGLNRHIFKHESAMSLAPDNLRKNSQEVALRVSRNFLNDTTHLTLLAVVLGWDAKDGSLLRADVKYDLRDALALNFGFVLYQSGELPPLDSWGRNDRFIFSVKGSF